MKYFKNIFCSVLLIGVGLGCTDMEELQLDPNRTVNASPELLLTHLEIEAFAENVDLSSGLANRYLTNADGESSFQYYTWQRWNYSHYDDIKQAVSMAIEAERTGQEIYGILADFFIAHFAIELTQRFGDVPYSEAANLENGTSTPVYDTQREIYLDVLDRLASVADRLAQNDDIISGDVIYNGDKLKWRKLVNSYRLRVLMNLSRKESETGFDIRQSFAQVVDNPSQYPIFESAEDAGIIDYVNVAGNRHPLHNDNSLQTAYYMERTFIDRLISLNDPRLFELAEQTPNAVSDGLAVDDFSAYGGLLGSEPFSTLAIPATEGDASRIKPRYYNDPVNEPGVLLGYPELQFILAEAVERGWINGDAIGFYEEGIRASMEFYGITDETAIEDYLDQANVQLEGNNALEQILTQKHIALFMNSNWQIYYEQRRTGFPVYDTSGGGVGNNGEIPKRFLYPQSEINNNNANLEIAIGRQFGAGDDVNGVMWILQ